jgi:transposase-like protein
MSVLSYVHQLFNVDQCQAYIHTLRWKDRPLQCPRCQSQDVDPWGQYHYRPGCKRYWCNGCHRTFNDLTHTLLGVGHMTVDTCGKPYLPTLHTAFKAHIMKAEVPRSSKESWCPNMAIRLA